MNFRRLTRRFWLPLTIIAAFIFSTLTTIRPAIIPVTRVNSQEPSLLAQQQIARVSPLYQLMRIAVNGERADLVGVYAPNDFSYPIIQQPSDDSVFVSSDPGVVTQFAAATHFGTVGLLAHNTLAGASFYDLHLGDKILLIYGDGSARPYSVSSIRQFQALDPSNPYSNFLDLGHDRQELTSKDLFKRIYSTPDQLVLQTCIDKDGEPSWGRIFITASPDEKKSGPYWPDFWQVFSIY
jgi:hypothetical protein